MCRCVEDILTVIVLEDLHADGDGLGGVAVANDQALLIGVNEGQHAHVAGTATAAGVEHGLAAAHLGQVGNGAVLHACNRSVSANEFGCAVLMAGLHETAILSYLVHAGAVLTLRAGDFMSCAEMVPEANMR